MIFFNSILSNYLSFSYLFIFPTPGIPIFISGSLDTVEGAKTFINPRSLRERGFYRRIRNLSFIFDSHLFPQTCFSFPHPRSGWGNPPGLGQGFYFCLLLFPELFFSFYRLLGKYLSLALITTSKACGNPID